MLVPVEKILKEINSCQNEEQIQKCRILISNYIKSAKKYGVINIDDLKNRLNEELLQRQESIYLSNLFNKKEED